MGYRNKIDGSHTLYSAIYVFFDLHFFLLKIIQIFLLISLYENNMLKTFNI